MTAFGFDHGPRFRFSAACTAVDMAGLNDLRIDILTPRDIALARQRYIGVKIKTFVTMFRAEEIEKMLKNTAKVEWSKPIEEFIAVLKRAAHDARDGMASADEKAKMI